MHASADRTRRDQRRELGGREIAQMTLKPELWGHMRNLEQRRNLEQGHAGVASITPASRGYSTSDGCRLRRG
jgi:hypothetical protein